MLNILYISTAASKQIANSFDTSILPLSLLNLPSLKQTSDLFRGDANMDTACSNPRLSVLVCEYHTNSLSNLMIVEISLACFNSVLHHNKQAINRRFREI
ncbi:hypothetical protein CDO73_08915 [Saccharibacillus sp. O23]|nr:hypothetical protein CDO73_08915 [Saccharibacillus sp. O23]